MYTLLQMSKKIIFEVAPEFKELEGWVRELPNHFESSGETIYQGRNEVKVFTVGNFHLNVKAFRVPNWVNRFAYVYLRGSKAVRSFQYARKFLQMGVNTPAAVGWLECLDGGLLAQSYYVSLHLNYDFTLREALKFEDHLKDEILHQWVDFTYEKLHQNGILHLDYSPGNTLITKLNDNYQFSIVDLNRMSFGPVGFEKGLSNFCRLEVDQRIVRAVGSQYALLCGKDPARTADRMVEIYRQADLKNKKWEHFKSIIRAIFKCGRAGK